MDAFVTAASVVGKAVPFAFTFGADAELDATTLVSLVGNKGGGLPADDLDGAGEALVRLGGSGFCGSGLFDAG